jgi:lipopolysaccharide/colanic/teichoic acid biosynthesis glycosyltransferase
MSKQQARLSQNLAGWQTFGSTAAAIGMLLLLLLAAWLYSEASLIVQPVYLSGATILFALHVLMVVVGERALAYVALSHQWKYRLAFLFSACSALVHWLLAYFTQSEQISLGWVPVAFAGALFGGLLVTWLRGSLWEDNSPPSALVREEVERMHFRVRRQPVTVSPLKRIFDLGLALFGLILSAPVWLLIVLLVWLEEPGPVLFVKNSVGLGGVNFHQYKFRTMIHGAERSTGPVLASEEDERVLLIGKILRKTALDELPQLINILKGEMSFVGPRPQRTVLVYEYLQELPEYADRHRVLPGLSGLAQVAGDYYLTPRQKLRFDCLYILHAGLGFDLKLLFLAFLITFWYRWQRAWNGRLPRRLLHARAPWRGLPSTSP